ncbi:hypothetical protein [Aeromicrobium sp. UC242_57]|uniref:hypothetical protein n=1 Tax=Aeromicrobium sp. UC242_57 TaxID=3374624 RepID=UPI00379D19AA
MAPDAADGASAPRAASAHQDPRMIRGDAPALAGTTGLFALFEPWPLQVAVEDVPAGHREGFLDLGRCLVLDTQDQRCDRFHTEFFERCDELLVGLLGGGLVG